MKNKYYYYSLILLLLAAPAYCLQSLTDDAVDTSAEVNVINNNLRELDSRKQNKELPTNASDIDNAITSLRAGQQIFNDTALEVCVSTQAGSSTAWVKMHAPTTACSN